MNKYKFNIRFLGYFFKLCSIIIFYFISAIGQSKNLYWRPLVYGFGIDRPGCKAKCDWLQQEHATIGQRNVAVI